MNENDHINPTGSITVDTGNTAIILKADDTHHEEKDAIRKELIQLQITVKERHTLSQYPGQIHLREFPSENVVHKITPR